MIVLDVETTGTDPQLHSIIEFGAVEYEHPENRFAIACQAFPGALLSERALEVNGYDAQRVFDPSRPTLEDATRQAIAWSYTCADRTLAGQQIGSFDTRFLQTAVRLADTKWPFGIRTVDLHAVALSALRTQGLPIPLRFGVSALTVDSILALVGLPAEPKPHLAINGALLETEAYGRFWTGKPYLPEYQAYPVPSPFAR